MTGHDLSLQRFFILNFDFLTMELVNKSFITKDDKEFHDDLIWKVKLKNRNRHIYIYSTLEFQLSVSLFICSGSFFKSVFSIPSCLSFAWIKSGLSLRAMVKASAAFIDSPDAL